MKILTSNYYAPDSEKAAEIRNELHSSKDAIEPVEISQDRAEYKVDLNQDGTLDILVIDTEKGYKFNEYYKKVTVDVTVPKYNDEECWERMIASEQASSEENFDSDQFLQDCLSETKEITEKQSQKVVDKKIDEETVKLSVDLNYVVGDDALLSRELVGSYDVFENTQDKDPTLEDVNLFSVYKFLHIDFDENGSLDLVILMQDGGVYVFYYEKNTVYENEIYDDDSVETVAISQLPNLKTESLKPFYHRKIPKVFEATYQVDLDGDGVEEDIVVKQSLRPQKENYTVEYDIYGEVHNSYSYCERRYLQAYSNSFNDDEEDPFDYRSQLERIENKNKFMRSSYREEYMDNCMDRTQTKVVDVGYKEKTRTTNKTQIDVEVFVRSESDIEQVYQATVAEPQVLKKKEKQAVEFLVEDVVCDDLNQDGHLDLALIMQDGSMHVIFQGG